MATILLGAAGAAIGGSIGGSFLGVGAAVIGRGIGGAIGAVVDSYLFAPNYKTEGPRLTDLNVTTSSEGSPINRLYGRSRIGGQVIWATRLRETQTTEEVGGGKGGGGGQSVTSYAYSQSFAVALCEGSSRTTLGRVWLDGNELDLTKYVVRFYNGAPDQLPDGFIETVEGVDNTPAYRGICYLVFEEMPLEEFGNRMPNVSAEVFKPVDSDDPDIIENALTAVTMIPASGEFAYATTPYVRTDEEGNSTSENTLTLDGRANIVASLDQLLASAPNIQSINLVVAWFGDDLRMGECTVTPRVETDDPKSFSNADARPWQVSGLVRATAPLVPEDPSSPGSPIYGGTPSDQSVREAIEEIKSRGLRCVFYPFVLMTQLGGNGLPSPYGGSDQPALPWRGRITCHPAAGQPGTVDKTAAAAAQVQGFFGSASLSDVGSSDGLPTWTGASTEFGYRRMVLHYARLCQLAGGVDAFLVGTELRGITRVRSSQSDFPSVTALQTLAAEVKGVLGASTKISYAADWSEFNAYNPGDGTGDLYFNLDPLWADPNVDFIGIDNYLPLSDFRDGDGENIHDPEYLMTQVEAGEHYDYFYASDEDRENGVTTPITDGANNEPWAFRQKDLRGWWSNPHHDRPGGVRSSSATAWTPKSKPFWFTEFGCPAVDKGTNQPNVFFDPKSSESLFPYHSNGQRDDVIQRAYTEATIRYWRTSEGNNPTDGLYGGSMVSDDDLYAWTWDSRPYPQYPRLGAVWSDGENYDKGHWLTGRLGLVPLTVLAEEVCGLVGVVPDVQRLIGKGAIVHGYVIDNVMSPRDMLSSLFGAFSFDGYESAGRVRFSLRQTVDVLEVSSDDLVHEGDDASGFSLTRQQETELPSSVKVRYIDESSDYGPRAADGKKLVGKSLNTYTADFPVVMPPAQARRQADVLLHEAWMARETGSLGLPPSMYRLDPGDVVRLPVPDRGNPMDLRLNSVNYRGWLELEGSRHDATIYDGPTYESPGGLVTVSSSYGPALLEFMDLPLLTGEEPKPWAPRLVAYQRPAPTAVNVFRSVPDADDFLLNTAVSPRGAIGELTGPLSSGPTAVWDEVNTVSVRLYSTDVMPSVTEESVFAGRNALAVQTPSGAWEVLQFRQAELTGTRSYALTGLLRGQLGTEGDMAAETPAGARVCFIDASELSVLQSTQSQRTLPFDYRYGPSSKPISDFTYKTEGPLTFRGIGLRPYSPVHLAVRRDVASGDLAMTWIRRTRYGGDDWDLESVPLNEERELYTLEVLDAPGGNVLRTVTGLPQASFVYTAAMQVADWGAVRAQVTVRVYQISATFGRGAPAERTLYA